MNTKTATPAEIDEQIRANAEERALIKSNLQTTLDEMHRAAGDTRTRVAGAPRRTWIMSDEDVLEAVRTQTTDTALQEWTRAHAARLIAKHEQGLPELNAAQQAVDPLHAEYTARGGWNRFYLVTAAGGHIHSSLHCGTCNRRGKPTQFAWITTLSGQDEEAVVKSEGAKLCTVCFPSAPLEWTNFWAVEEARKAAEACPGSGTRDWVEGSRTKRGSYADCEHCGQQTSVTPTNKFRKHKAPAGK